MPIDTSLATKAPPRKSTGRGNARASVATHMERSPREIREEGLLGVGQTLQGICILAQQWADAGAIGMHFPKIAPELAKLADQYSIVATGVDLAIQVGPFGALIAAVMPLGMQILANHKMIDASNAVGLGNVVPPEVLEATMKADMMRQVAQAQREQAEAMREAQAAQAEYAKVMNEIQSPNGAGNDHAPMGV